MDTEKLELARTFLDNVRLTQKESGKLARGRNRLSSETSDAMNIQLDSISKLIDILELPNDTAKKLCERFEEICRRRRMKMIDEIRREIYELLIFELSINTQELEMEPDQLVSVTLLSEVPAGFILQEKEFEWFKGNLGIVKRAAEKYSNPREFLRTVKETVEEILEEEEFKCFSKNKWVIQHAAVKHSKPKKFLRTVKETVEEILEDKEFERFKNSLGIVLKAVVWHSSDPKDFLRSQPTSSL